MSCIVRVSKGVNTEAPCEGNHEATYCLFFLKFSGTLGQSWCYLFVITSSQLSLFVLPCIDENVKRENVSIFMCSNHK